MTDIEATLVEFRSNLGNTILYPSHWIPNDNKTVFSISAPNGQATISCMSFTKEGSGSLVDFGRLILSELTGLKESEWETFEIDANRALKWESDVEDSDAESHWLIYVVECGDCYHALLVELIELIMMLNWKYYEKLIETFKGISEIPKAG